MIFGIGNDMVDIRRIERALERHGERFTHRVFTETERAKSERRAAVSPRHRASSYAKRFAAKEACVKALGTGFSNGVFHKDIGVVNLCNRRTHAATCQWCTDGVESITGEKACHDNPDDDR